MLIVSLLGVELRIFTLIVPDFRYICAMKVDVTQATEAYREAYRDLTGDKFHRAAARALNHTARKARTNVSKSIREEYRIKAKDIKAAIRLGNASSSQLSTYVRATGKSLPVAAFRHRQTRQGVSVSIMGKRKVIKKAFVATMESGHTGVFARGRYKRGGFDFRYKRIADKDRNDLPIQELHTTSIPSAMSKQSVLERVADKISIDYPTRLNHLLGRSSRLGKIKYNINS